MYRLDQRGSDLRGADSAWLDGIFLSLVLADTRGHGDSRACSLVGRNALSPEDLGIADPGSCYRRQASGPEHGPRATCRSQRHFETSNCMKNWIALLCVGIAFLALFLPYLLWKTIEARINGLPSETAIVSRLAGMALREMFREQ